MAKKMPDVDREREFADEAQRLRQLPRAEQRAILDMHRVDANNPKVPKADRDFARQRVKALERMLKLVGKQ